MLDVRGLTIAYGKNTAVRDLTLGLKKGEIVALVGANGAGKSSILKALLGITPAAGAVAMDGTVIERLPTHKRIAAGLALSPEGRRVFPAMTVLENLELGFVPAGSASVTAKIEEVTASFPRLRERFSQLAGTMSGGEQQMLAIARALMSTPRLLMLDEPTLGLSPLMVGELVLLLRELRDRGLAVLLAEQNAEMALNVADRAYVLEMGRIVMEGKAADLREDSAVQAAYLGM